MKRCLAFFEPDMRGSIEKPLERAFEVGARNALVIDTKDCGRALANALEKTGFSWVEKQLMTFQKSDIADADVVLVPNGSCTDVSRALHACIGSDVTVIAPVTEHHYSRRTVFLMAIPKAGTHMVIRLLDLMGLCRSPDRAPRLGTWCTPVGYAYHAPCRELMADDWFDPIGRQLLLRSPAIFVYRNPLDIVVSELDWFVRPENAFSGYLNCCADESEQLERLIADDTVMGNIRDRINRYAGWMHFSNVIPVSYEELVGSRGGGSDTEQLDAIWALQLKLHIPGSPKEFGARLYDPASATFSKGRIGRHMEYFKEHHFTLLDSLPQDFMQALGYVRGSKTSSKVMDLRQRPLVVKELLPDILYMPRLVREGVMGWNIVEVAGKYFPVRQGEHIMSAVEAESVLAGKQGFVTLRDAMDAVIHGGKVTALATESQLATGTELAVEGWFGFNVVRHGGCWYGFDQATGPIDIDSLGKSVLNEMKRDRRCVIGGSSADIKAEILRHVIQTRERHESELSVQTNEQLSGVRSQLEESLKSLTQRVSAIVPEPNKEPRLLEENYRGFNLVAYEGKVWGVAIAAGAVDWHDTEVREQLTTEGRLMEARTVDGARAAVDIRVIEQHVHATETRFNEIKTLLSELKVSKQLVQDTAGELAGLRRHLVETTTSLEKLVEESQQAITQAKLDLQRQIEDVKSINLARLHEESQQSVSRAKSNLEEQIRDLRQNTLVRVGAYITKKNKKVRETDS